MDDCDNITNLLLAAATILDGIKKNEDGSYEIRNQLPVAVGIESWEKLIAGIEEL